MGCSPGGAHTLVIPTPLGAPWLRPPSPQGRGVLGILGPWGGCSQGRTPPLGRVQPGAHTFPEPGEGAARGAHLPWGGCSQGRTPSLNLASTSPGLLGKQLVQATEQQLVELRGPPGGSADPSRAPWGLCGSLAPRGPPWGSAESASRAPLGLRGSWPGQRAGFFPQLRLKSSPLPAPILQEARLTP